jgi:hypothetical protein
MYLVHNGDSFELPSGELLVGRDAPCQLRFDDHAVSRRHLRIVCRSTESFVEDLGSTNGTLLNGQITTGPVVLGDGDVIRVGTRELCVRMGDDAFSEVPTVELGDQWAQPAGPSGPTVRFANNPLRAIGVAVAAPGRMHSPTLPLANVLARRGPARLAVELEVLYVSSELEVETTTRDLSLTGVRVSSQVLDAVGTRCELTILADAMPRIQVGGVVRRVVMDERADGGPAGMGVEFTPVGTVEHSWLKTVIARFASAA